jgi:hypothetical protein
LQESYMSASDIVGSSEQRLSDAQEELAALEDPAPTASPEERDAVALRRTQLQERISDTTVRMTEAQSLLIPVAVSYGLRSCHLATDDAAEATCDGGRLERGSVMAAFYVTIAVAGLLAIFWSLVQVEYAWMLPLSNDSLWYSPIFAGALCFIFLPPFSLVAGYYRSAASYVVPPQGWFLDDRGRLILLTLLAAMTSVLVAAVSVRIGVSARAVMIAVAFIALCLLLAYSAGGWPWTIATIVVLAILWVWLWAKWEAAVMDFAIAVVVLWFPLVGLLILIPLEWVLGHQFEVDNWVTASLRLGALAVCAGQIARSRIGESQIRKAVAYGTVDRSL